MASRIQLDGFREFKAAMLALPQEARDDADAVLRDAAERAAVAVAQIYPEISGKLRKGLRVLEMQPRGLAAFYQVQSTAAYAHIYEFGSKYAAPRPTFLPVTELARRAAVQVIAANVMDQGLVVEGARD